MNVLGQGLSLILHNNLVMNLGRVDMNILSIASMLLKFILNFKLIHTRTIVVERKTLLFVRWDERVLFIDGSLTLIVRIGISLYWREVTELSHVLAIMV